MDTKAIQSAAQLLSTLRQPGNSQARQLVDLPPECRPASVDDAYHIQARLRSLLAASERGPVIGWKIGCTTPVMQEYLNIDHPCAGTLFDSTLYSDGAELVINDYFRIGLECEIAVQLGDNLPDRSQPYDRQSVANAVEWVMPSIEIVDERFADFRQTSSFSLIADDFFSAGCVLGKRVAMEQAGDLAVLRGGFEINGNEPEHLGLGSEIMRHPLNALAWLANQAVLLDAPLQAGSVITLGSVVKTVYPTSPCRVSAAFAGLGKVSIHLS